MAVSDERHLVDEIAMAIVSTELPAGTHLTAAGLAERLDVSRTPIRESLRELEALGLVELLGRRGAFVVDPADIDATAMRDLVETRRLVEPHVLGQAAERSTGADHRRSEAALADGDRAMARGDGGRLNIAHHRLLTSMVAGSHNDAAIRALRPLHFRTCLVVARTAAITLPEGWKVHRRVAEAIERGDGATAAALHSDHLGEVLESLA
ncbi:MAG: GntR family transcriptional regulator [Actinomycetota bacterium]